MNTHRVDIVTIATTLQPWKVQIYFDFMSHVLLNHLNENIISNFVFLYCSTPLQSKTILPSSHCMPQNLNLTNPKSESKSVLHRNMRNVIRSDAKPSPLGPIPLQVQKIPKSNGTIIPRQSLIHGTGIGVSVQSGEASTDLQSHLTFGGKSHRESGAVEASDSVEVEGGFCGSIGGAGPLHPINRMTLHCR
mmetsp:Transcript_23800/g.49852  ORF Transcript_23800/g.49852 Transcript_23800/m.49852 type:complete len:191 (-) Transcript_23800:160-732(-)